MLSLTRKICEEFELPARLMVLSVYTLMEYAHINGKSLPPNRMASLTDMSESQVRAISEWIKNAERELAGEALSFAPGSLATTIENTFLDKAGPEYVYRIERPMIKSIVTRIMEFSSDEDEQIAIATMIIETFFEMTESNDRYWGSMPFIPSRLAHKTNWPAVLKKARKKWEQAKHGREVGEELSEVFNV